ncbi:MAG TPA: hypothetical protein VF194_14575 [Ferrovibrio sp.]|uniref:hypothetical protein n=1 Tax=Ferrovibrio sp. TaxID=1917215 RepID=UPI002ED41AF0
MIFFLVLIDSPGARHVPDELPEEVVVGFDPDWILEFVPYDGFPRWRTKTVVPIPYMRIESKGAIYPARRDEPERVVDGSIDFAIDPKNEGHKPFMRAFFSLLGKYCSNRHQV